MSIGKIHPSRRGFLRLHGWLLMGWALLVGLIVSAVLLHVLHVESMAIRFTVGAGAIYFIGFVLGGRWYFQWWNKQSRMAADFPQHASVQDELEYEKKKEEVNKLFNKFDGMGDLANLGGGDDPLSALLAVIALIVMLVFLALLLGYFPFFATEVLAGYLAEIVLEFVIGAIVLRRVIKPRDEREYWGFVIRKTWLAGLMLVVLAAGLGYVIQDQNPAATTLFQAFRT